MSKADTLENDLLLLLFNNTAMTLVGDAGGLGGSTVAGNFYVSLHTADPGETGTQLTNECAYSGYARVAVARTGAAWVVVANACSNVSALTFATCTAGAETVTHFGIGTSAGGAGKLLYSGEVSPTRAVAVGIAPVVPAGGLSITED